MPTSGVYYIDESGSRIDGQLGLYSAAFDPLDPAANCVAGVDSLGGAFISAGTYTAVFSNFAPTQTGLVSYRFNGPGEVTIRAPGPAPVPTLSEWAMILFGTVLAGGAALYLQRRRRFV